MKPTPRSKSAVVTSGSSLIPSSSKGTSQQTPLSVLNPNPNNGVISPGINSTSSRKDPTTVPSVASPSSSSLTNNSAAADAPSSVSSSSDSPIMVALDTVVAVVGFIAVVVTFLAVVTGVFEADEGSIIYGVAYDADDANSATGSGVNSADETSKKALPSPKRGGPNTKGGGGYDVDTKIHALFDATVGREKLLSVVKARFAHRDHLKQTRKRVAIDDAVKHGRVAGGGGAEQSLSLSSQPLNKIYSEDEARIEQGIEDESQKELEWLKLAGKGPAGIVAGSAVIWQQEPEGRKLQTYSIDEEMNIFDDEATFYMSIAQFKDVLCPITIKEIYQQARNPRRIFAGIVDQREDNTEILPGGIGSPHDNVVPRTNLDGTCFPWYMMDKCRLNDFCPTDNIRVRRAKPKEGKGPTWGRYYGMLMYQGEKYFMMIDSHSRFVPHWDAQSVLNLHLLPKTTKKAVLSHYPGGFESYYSLMTPRREMWRMVMCAAHYTTVGIIRMDSVAFPPNGFPDQQPFSAGGYVFGDARYVHEVPFDPYLYYVFDGEEVLYSVRLWTHGFDLFTPRSNILFHNYARHNAPRFWNIGINYGEQQKLGNARVKYFMKSFNNQTNVRMVPDEWAKQHHVDREEEIYGLGKERALEEYYAYARADPVKWTVNGSFCDEIMHARHRHKYHLKKDLGG